MSSLEQARALIRDIPDFPQPGILFKDITPVLGDPKALQAVLDALEYGKGTLEAHVDAVQPGEKVAVVDDLLATGGTAWGAGQLVKKQRGEVGVFLFVIELTFLKGRERLEETCPVEALFAY